MADEFPDPDEEFELMHAAEMEMMQEMEMENFDDEMYADHDPGPKAKRSLDFKNTKNDSLKLSPPPEVEPLLNNSFLSQNETSKTTGTQLSKSQQGKNSSILENGQDPVNTENILVALNENGAISNKRRVEDLFGDIDDIYFDDEHTSKKSKNDELTEDEKQQMTIETILFERKRLQESKILPRLTNSNSRFTKSNKVKFCRTVPRYNFMPLTDGKGERLYTRLHTEEDIEKEISEMTNQTPAGGLLSIPFEQLQKLAEEQLQRKWDRIEKVQQEQQSRLELEIFKEKDEDLWVEKYKPKNYLELLSDEGTNRALLQWLKLWDKVVFGIERKVKAKHKDDGKHKGYNKFQRKTGPIVSDELDEHGRPIHKIALLCGPPGLGKTTLAHMIAHQAGYNVVEVNASDDRSPEVFRTQLEAATQMRAVMGAERRPNCLVLDEIDGAPSTSIDVLLKFALGKGSLRGKGAKAKKAAGGDKTNILKRPIICICNDVYVPALRPLRQAAFVVHFPPTSTARLAQRLCEITRQQHLKTDLGAMMALSEKTNNDIRACLGLLQCLKTQATNGQEATVRLSQIHAATIGEKDMQKGLFTVWQEIFQIPKPKRKTFVETVSRDAAKAALDLDSCNTKTSTSTLSERIRSVLKTVQGCGDYDRLAQGVFENYLNMKSKDSTMVSISSGLSWFCTFDLMSTKIHTTQNYVLYPYLAYPFVIWHLLFASLTWPKLAYPSTGYEMSVRLQKCTQLVDEVLKSMVASVRAYTYREQLIQDTLPLLLEIIVPVLRPVSLTLYNSKEKAEMSHVISVMIDYNLTYTQERTADGSFHFNLDPNVEEVSRFEGVKGRTLSYAVRQLMSREIELEKLRRAEASLYRDSTPAMSDTTVSASPSKRKLPSTPKGAGKKALPNHLQRLTPKAVNKPEDLQTKDFFGRVVENSLVPNQRKARTDEIVKSDIWYHFKEGFNNAVRRNVTMADLY
ncbi:chromosome transmission fidelity protein 18 homolog [Macrosteles quadrilineatus]|uniref:chromosome transmission fidelity protein 18 homolog n=1 Tax=Macrosteles quadrilineatus TaxID=74068 RepID=UPI0023E12412|nr:chromosome transmission fidelity protein 18 homolog [Macrosteles quadrilineatus]